MNEHEQLIHLADYINSKQQIEVKPHSKFQNHYVCVCLFCDEQEISTDRDLIGLNIKHKPNCVSKIAQSVREKHGTLTVKQNREEIDFG